MRREHDELRFIAALPYTPAKKNLPTMVTLQAYGAIYDDTEGLFLYTRRLRDKIPTAAAKGLIHNLNWSKHVLRKHSPYPRSMDMMPSNAYFLSVWRGGTPWYVLRVLSRPGWDVERVLELHAAVEGVML